MKERKDSVDARHTELTGRRQDRYRRTQI